MELFDFLCRFDRAAWQRAHEALSGEIHDIDRNATKIWLAFYPLDLHLALESATDQAAVARRLGLMGEWRLSKMVDTSHRFFFAHRYWPQVKSAIQHPTAQFPDSLPALVTQFADAAARTARVDREFLTGLTLVGLMTLRQSGTEAFSEPGKVHLPPDVRARSPHQVLKLRLRDTSQGLFGFLRGLKKRWKVIFDENDPAAAFTVIDDQEVASGAQSDRRDFRERDARCIPGEGPIPVECRAASCGTCWVGILAGADTLSPVSPREEGRRLSVFGYSDGTESQPLIRLACQARAHGAVSLVIPPWNGIIGTLRG